jgi:polysaccharide export outer membrane protein
MKNSDFKNQNYVKPLFLLVLLGLLMFTSCVSNKRFVYLRDKGNVKMDSTQHIIIEQYNYKIQCGDILFISLMSEDDRINKIFVPSAQGQIMMGGVTGSPYYFTGFTVDPEGKVELPYVGRVKVSGLDLEGARSALSGELSKYFKVFFLQVKMAEFRFSVLGAVRTPGQFFFQQNKVTILDAILRAGDLQDIAIRHEIQLFRQYPEGVKMVKLDITDRSIMNSPYWYMQPNDLLYVIPIKTRTIGDFSSLQNSLNSIAPIFNTFFLLVNSYLLYQTIYR